MGRVAGKEPILTVYMLCKPTFIDCVIHLFACLFVCSSLKEMMKTPTLGTHLRLSRNYGSFVRIFEV